MGYRSSNISLINKKDTEVGNELIDVDDLAVPLAMCENEICQGRT